MNILTPEEYENAVSEKLQAATKSLEKIAASFPGDMKAILRQMSEVVQECSGAIDTEAHKEPKSEKVLEEVVNGLEVLHDVIDQVQLKFSPL